MARALSGEAKATRRPARLSCQALTFWGGIDTLWDFAGNLRFRADAERPVLHDWNAVGDILWEAMELFEGETGIHILKKYSGEPELAAHE